MLVLKFSMMYDSTHYPSQGSLIPLLSPLLICHPASGVAGFVVNKKGEVLLVQEKWLRRLSLKHWKLPGGHTEKGVTAEREYTIYIFHTQTFSNAHVHANTHLLLMVIRALLCTICSGYFVDYIHIYVGEELWETAVRETWEETGIRSQFVSMLCFRHMHGYRWGTDDIYFACLLRPLTTDITIHPAEIADAKWMDVC